MQITPINSCRNQQSFQAGLLQIGGQKPIPYSLLDKVVFTYGMDKSGRNIATVTLPDKCGRVLRKFKRDTIEAAASIMEQLNKAIRATKEAPNGKVIHFVIDGGGDKMQLRKPPKRAIDKPPVFKNGNNRFIPLNSIKPGVIITAEESGYKIVVDSNAEHFKEPLWTWEEEDHNIAFAIARTLNVRIIQAKKQALRGGERVISLDKIARAFNRTGREALPEESFPALCVMNG